MGGGRYPSEDGKEQKQKAVIEFLCDDSSEKRRRGVSLRDDEEEGGEERNEGETTDDGDGGTLSFLSYEDVGEEKVLSLKWHTKRACESEHEDDGKASGGHWGFFTWFIIV